MSLAKGDCMCFTLHGALRKSTRCKPCMCCWQCTHVDRVLSLEPFWAPCCYDVSIVRDVFILTGQLSNLQHSYVV